MPSTGRKAGRRKRVGHDPFLQSTSPAVDAGTDHAVYQTYFNLYGVSIKVDAAKTPRPRGVAIDIGPFESL